MAISPTTILEVGATLVGIGGYAGAFYAGYKSRKSTDTADANETIDLKDKAIQALRDEVGELTKRVNEQDAKIKTITDINNAYIRLFSGDPSRLEDYMRQTAEALAAINSKLHSAPSVVVQNQPQK